MGGVKGIAETRRRRLYSAVPMVGVLAGYRAGVDGLTGGRASVIAFAGLRRALAVVTCVGCAGLLAACGQGTGSMPAANVATSLGASIIPVADREQVPAISGTTLTGEPFQLRDLVGHGVVVVNVWASWCTSCREEARPLAELATALEGRSVTFVGLDEQDNRAGARSVVAAAGASYPQLLDPDGTLLDQLKLLPSYGIPSTLVVDRHGLMAARIIGPTTSDKLRKLVAQVQTEA